MKINRINKDCSRWFLPLPCSHWSPHVRGRLLKRQLRSSLNSRILKAGTGKIAFAAQSNEDVMFDLYFINAGTGKLYQVTENPHSDISPDFSRDGMRMVFSSNRVDTYDIFTINLPSGSPILLFENSTDEYRTPFFAGWHAGRVPIGLLSAIMIFLLSRLPAANPSG